jgi:hypothetical protein
MFNNSIIILFHVSQSCKINVYIILILFHVTTKRMRIKSSMVGVAGSVQFSFAVWKFGFFGSMERMCGGFLMTQWGMMM